MSGPDDLQEPLLEKLSGTPESASKGTVSISKKRKRGVIEQGAKKAAKKTKAKKFAGEEDELDIDAGINRAFSHMDNQLLADYVAQRTRKYESDLSSIELEDKHIPGARCHVPLPRGSLTYADEASSKCDPRYDFVGQAQNSGQFTRVFREILWKFNEAMGSLEEEWRASYYNRDGGRLKSS
jgi:hypothetical protein